MLILTDTKNNILRTMPPQVLTRLESDLRPTDMPQGKVLYDVGETIDHLYLPNTAMVSVVAASVSGELAEAGVIGWEALAGIEALIGNPLAINRYLVQLPGTGWRISLRAAKDEFALAEHFHDALLAFTRELMAQMSQTALCNRLHIAERRLAKWLLMCHDRSESSEMHITQEFAALMLGSSRVSVSQAAGVIQTRGLIEYKRGRVTILDRAGLESFACECYERIKKEFDLLINAK